MKTYKPTKRRAVLLLIVLCITFCIDAIDLIAAPLNNIPQTLRQPDGTIINCFASGDEYYHWLHDKDGYTIIKSPKTGYYVYAVEKEGLLEASDIIVGKGMPNSKGLKPYAKISQKNIDKKRAQYKVPMKGCELSSTKGLKSPSPISTTTSTMNNIVIYIKFADDSPDTEPISFWNDLYNGSTLSLSNYFLEASYNQFTVSSTFYPAPSMGNVVWYTDSHTREYYEEYNAATNTEGYDPDVLSSNGTNPAGKTYREHNLLKNALTSIASSVPTSLNLDSNGDGYVDCVSFIVAGAPNGWNDLIWPHRWSLWSIDTDIKINELIVSDYTFQMQYRNSNRDRMSLGVVAHEMFHVVGAPDLYHYAENSTIDPVGPWDIMEATGSKPQHMTAYMKYMYGNWISSIPEITQTGTYTLNPLASSSTQNCYKIPSSNSYTEYYMVEYRKKTLYDSYALPGEGLIVYKINSRYEGDGNADGPPDEVYVYRENGTLTSNGTVNNAFYSLASGRTSINESTNPSAFLSDGTYGGLKISNIGAAGSSISFDVNINYTPIVVLRNDKGGLYSGIGSNSKSMTFTAASRYTIDDLTGVVGKYLRKVEFFISDSFASNVTVKVWQGGSSGNPGTLVYQKGITDINPKKWNTHTLDQAIQIETGKEYWVGYTLTEPAGRYCAGIDRGPAKSGKGDWLQYGGTWSELVNSGLNFNFMIRGIVESTPTAIETIDNKGGITLEQNYPNPFSNETTIKFKLDSPGHVTINVFNSIGQKVRTLVDKNLEASSHEVEFNSNGLNSGIYYYTLIFNEGKQGSSASVITKKMSIIR